MNNTADVKMRGNFQYSTFGWDVRHYIHQGNL